MASENFHYGAVRKRLEKTLDFEDYKCKIQSRRTCLHSFVTALQDFYTIGKEGVHRAHKKFNSC